MPDEAVVGAFEPAAVGFEFVILKRKMGAVIRHLLVRGLAEGVAGPVAWLIFIR